MSKINKQSASLFLKSALQKSIRLGLVDTSASLAQLLINHNSIELIRRLPIIMMEDSLVTNDIIEIVNIMLHKPKILPPDYQQFLIQTTANAAASEHRETLFQGETTLFNSKHTNALTKAILKRAEYGGMRFDLNLCHFRAMEYSHKPAHKLPAVEYTLIDLTPELIPKTSVDQHCSSIVKNILENSDLVYQICKITKQPCTYKLIAQVIWSERSSINYKKLPSGKIYTPPTLVPNQKEVANLINPICDEYATNYIKTYLPLIQQATS